MKTLNDKLLCKIQTGGTHRETFCVGSGATGCCCVVISAGVFVIRELHTLKQNKVQTHYSSVQSSR